MNRKIIGYYNYTVVLTYLGMISACVAVFLAIGGSNWLAIWFMMFAGLCDMFDGTVASTKKDRDDNQKSFGIQIDSLCDLVGFGVAPGIFVYSLSENKISAGIAAVFLILAAVIRLAYFNVLEANRQKQESGHRKSYLGVPVTTIVLVMPIVYVLNALGVFRSEYFFQATAVLVGIGFITPVYIKKPQRAGKIALIVLGLLEAVGMLIIRKYV
ncbi:MAG: CDP-alcohol phosphatidyltransferase family protein [Clostridia bacterium]|nr:CDP-alcohol phosphatidyltransferase family protein [Clostridia bacterium]